MNINLGNADIITAFDEHTIGTKVPSTSEQHGPVNREMFMMLILDAIRECDFSAQRVPGQAFLMLPAEARLCISAGVATRSNNDAPDDFVIRKYREGCKLYLKRSVAERQGRNKATGCAVVVYTLDACLADPDVKGTEEAKRVVDEGLTHILVAVLGFSGPKAPLPPFRFVHNLAGGNLEALEWSADEIRTKAKEIIDYANNYIAVAD